MFTIWCRIEALEKKLRHHFSLVADPKELSDELPLISEDTEIGVISYESFGIWQASGGYR
jgi:hypothetical protein